MKSNILLIYAAAVLIFAVAFLAGCGSGSGPGGSGPGSGNSRSPAARGDEIVAEYLQRDSAPFRRERVRFTITEEGVPEKVYEVENWRKKAGDETTTYTVFVSPAEDAGLGSLTYEAKGKKTVIVTHSESRNDYRETDTSKTFFGGLTAGELLGEWYRFDYTYIGEKSLDGVNAYEVEGELRPGESSPIASMKVLFRADNYLPVELHLFASSGKEIRTYRATKINADGEHPYVSRVEVDNHVHNTHIVIEKLSQEFPEKVDDSMFQRERLKRGSASDTPQVVQ